MSKSVLLPEDYAGVLDRHGFTEDWDHFVSADRWTSVLTDTGSAASVPDVVGGLLRLSASGATTADNDEAYVHRTSETVLFADAKPGFALGKVKWAEVNTDDANVIWGLADAWAADHLQDAGAGPPDSYSGAVFYKVDGGTKWIFETSLGSTQTTTTLAATAPNGASDWHTIAFHWWSRDATTICVQPWIDEAGGKDLKVALDANGAKVQHTITLGSPVEMAFGFGVKAGGATDNGETLDIGPVSCYQKR